MAQYNIPNNIIYERFYERRPEVLAVYQCVYDTAIQLGSHTYTSPHGGSIVLDRDQGVCARDYIAGKLRLSDDVVKSALRTLENYGYIIKITQDKIIETVYKIPTICDAIAGTFTRLELPDVKTLWQRGKYLLTTLLYIGISANTDDTHDHYAKTITDDGIVRRGSLITNYDSICYYTGCTYNVARSVVAALKEMQLIVCDGYKRLGLYIKYVGYTVKEEIKQVAKQAKQAVTKIVNKIVKPVSVSAGADSESEEQKLLKDPVYIGVNYYAYMRGWIDPGPQYRVRENVKMLIEKLDKTLPELDRNKVLGYMQRYTKDYTNTQNYKGTHFEDMNHNAYYTIIKGYYDEEHTPTLPTKTVKQDERKDKMIKHVLDGYKDVDWIRDIQIIPNQNGKTDIILPSAQAKEYVDNNKTLLKVMCSYYGLINIRVAGQ